MKGDKNMDYKTMRDRIEDMVNDNHKDFIKAIISMEKVSTMKVFWISFMTLIWTMTALIYCMRNLTI